MLEFFCGEFAAPGIYFMGIYGSRNFFSANFSASGIFLWEFWAPVYLEYLAPEIYYVRIFGFRNFFVGILGSSNFFSSLNFLVQNFDSRNFIGGDFRL